MRVAPRAIAAIAAAGGYAALYRLGLVSGSTSAERSCVLPGDELISRPTLVTNHAATLPAPPERVWPWMTQVGWHRGGWYTPRWVDQLMFPDNWPSVDHLDSILERNLEPGDTIPDGPPGTAEFVVEPAWLDLAYRAVIVPADHIMATGMFDGLARRTTSLQGV